MSVFMVLVLRTAWRCGVQELKAAIKYGRKERANPGRDGDSRWRFTHRGVVYITDGAAATASLIALAATDVS
jgi:hypothetical protein